jgi:hypothetical protein
MEAFTSQLAALGNQKQSAKAFATLNKHPGQHLMIFERSNLITGSQLKADG